MEKLTLKLTKLLQSTCREGAFLISRAATRVWEWEHYMEDVAHSLTRHDTTADQWGNRLEEFCLDDSQKEEFWHMVGTGIAPYHAFAMIVGSIDEG